MGPVRLLIAGALAAGALAFGSPAAQAGAPPAIGSPGCRGLIVAEANHDNGADGPSGNPRASTGPGYFFGPGTAAAVHAVQDACP